MPLDLARVSALCFDVDGTLVDTDDHLVRQIAAWLRPFRILVKNKDLSVISRRLVMLIENPGNYLHTLTDQLHIDGLMDSMENQLYRRGYFANMDHYRMVPDIYEMLTQLHSRYPLAVVSARGERKTMALLEQFKLTSFFSAIATSQTCNYTKPHPDPILWVADQMGVKPESCIMIGDTTVDMRSGKAASAQTIGVLCGFGEREELLRAGADLIIAQTGEITEILLTNPLTI